MTIKIIYIALGGAVGSILRFILSNFFKIYSPVFPLGTLFINLIGCFFIGLFANYLYSKEISETFIVYFIIIGVLGSFTTFSSFSLEAIELLKQNKMHLSILYVIFSIFFCILASYLGLIINKS